MAELRADVHPQRYQKLVLAYKAIGEHLYASVAGAFGSAASVVTERITDLQESTEGLIERLKELATATTYSIQTTVQSRLERASEVISVCSHCRQRGCTAISCTNKCYNQLCTSVRPGEHDPMCGHDERGVHTMTDVSVSARERITRQEDDLQEMHQTTGMTGTEGRHVS